MIPLLFVIAITVATVVIGYVASRGAKTAADMMVAGRSVGVGLNAAAISGEYLSAASFLGIAGLVMKNGFDALWYPVGYAAGYLFLLLFIAGPLRRFGAYTIPDFAEGRFDSPRFRRIAVLFVLGIGFFYTMPQMKGAGVVMGTILGWPYWAGIAVVGSVITFNVATGGMKGITLVQAFQYWAKLFAISVPVFVIAIVKEGQGSSPTSFHAQKPYSLSIGWQEMGGTDRASRSIVSAPTSRIDMISTPMTVTLPKGGTIVKVDWPEGVEEKARRAYEARVIGPHDPGTVLSVRPLVTETGQVVYAALRLAKAVPALYNYAAGDNPPFVFGKSVTFKGAEGAPANKVAVSGPTVLRLAAQAPTTVLKSGEAGTIALFPASLDQRSLDQVSVFHGIERGERSSWALPRFQGAVGRSLKSGERVLVERGERLEVYDGAKLEFIVPSKMTVYSSDGVPNATPLETWRNPFGPLTQKHGYPLLYTFSLIVALVCGTAGLPHILVRFYTNPDGKAARRTAFWTMVMLGAFYVFTPVWGTLGRALLPILYANNSTDSVVIRLPEAVVPGVWGQILTGVTSAGAFAAFMSTFSGLLVSMSGAFAHDVYGTMIRPNASSDARKRAFQLAAVVIGIVAMGLGLLVETFDIATMVGWAFAIGAASYFPLLLLGTWWRGLTATGAATGMLLGGLLSLAAIVTSMLLDKKTLTLPVSPLVRGLMEQPAIWGVPLSIVTMVIVSRMTRPPENVTEKMLRLHRPEGS